MMPWPSLLDSTKWPIILCLLFVAHLRHSKFCKGAPTQKLFDHLKFLPIGFDHKFPIDWNVSEPILWKLIENNEFETVMTSFFQPLWARMLIFHYFKLGRMGNFVKLKNCWIFICKNVWFWKIPKLDFWTKIFKMHRKVEFLDAFTATGRIFANSHLSWSISKTVDDAILTYRM